MNKEKTELTPGSKTILKELHDQYRENRKHCHQTAEGRLIELLSIAAVCYGDMALENFVDQLFENELSNEPEN